VSDDALRELLRSPLEGLPRRSSRRWVRTLAVGLGGLTLGAALAGAAVLGLGTDEAADTTAVFAASTTTTSGPAPLGGSLHAEAAWVMQRADALLVGVHLIADPGTSPELPGSAAWELRLDDGRSVLFRADYAVFISPGVMTVEFPGEGIEIPDLEALVLRPARRALELSGVWEIDAGQLPWRGPAPGPIVTGEDFTLRATEVRIADNGGAIEWQLFGAAGRRALLDAEASWTAAGEDEPRVAAAEYRIGETPLQLSPLRADARWSGSIELYRLDDPDEPTFRSRWWGDPGTVAVEGLTVEFSVVVFEYADEGIEVPLAGVPVVTG
jgi:hypothetical protein